MDKLLDIFRSLKTDGNGKKRTGAIFGFLGGAVALLLIGLLSWRAHRNGKKLAKLLHEKAVNEEKKIRAKNLEKIARSEAKKKEAAERIAEIEKKIEVVDESIKVAKDIRQKTKETIEQIKDWDALDEYLNK